MQSFAIHECSLESLVFAVGVEIPVVVNDADFKEHAISGVGVSLRVLLGEMEPALLEGPPVGAEDGLPGEGGGSGKRVNVEIEGVIDAVELDCFSHGRVDY